MAGVEHALAGGVHHFERLHDRAGHQVVDAQAPAGHFVDALDVLLGHLVEDVLGAPCTLHLDHDGDWDLAIIGKPSATAPAPGRAGKEFAAFGDGWRGFLLFVFFVRKFIQVSFMVQIFVVKPRATHRRKAIRFLASGSCKSRKKQMPQACILLKAPPSVTAGDELRVNPNGRVCRSATSLCSNLTEKPQANGKHLLHARDHPFVLDEDDQVVFRLNRHVMVRH